MTKQSCLVHPAVTAWIRQTDRSCFGLARSFEAAVRALENVDLTAGTGIGAIGAMRGFVYEPTLAVPGAYRLYLLFEQEGPYVNVNGVGART